MSQLVDPFGREITYVRVSVTDRCDFRCVYCMAEDMTFLPKREILSLEELDRLCSTLVRLGVDKLRLTGGEPLVRRNIMWLIERLSRHLDSGDLRELTLTTNASQLEKYAHRLRELGVKRVNVSFDSLDRDKFKAITRWGNYDKVMRGLEAAKDAGLHVKLNTVALKGVNDDEFEPLMHWAHEQGWDITFIEVMPLGDVGESRLEQFYPLSMLRGELAKKYTLSDIPYKTGGPARYVQVEETGGRIGFITPMTHNFCESCNRVRVDCVGTMHMCLGQEDSADMRTPLRQSDDDGRLIDAIHEAISRKPQGHDFVIDRRHQRPAVGRHMSVTGG